MNTETVPTLHVEPALRAEAEELLHEGETILAFVEQSIRESIDRRRHHNESIARAIASRDEAARTGKYVSSDAVVSRLQDMLASAKAGR